MWEAMEAKGTWAPKRQNAKVSSLMHISVQTIIENKFWNHLKGER